jgi:hypothetical protein
MLLCLPDGGCLNIPIYHSYTVFFFVGMDIFETRIAFCILELNIFRREKLSFIAVINNKSCFNLAQYALQGHWYLRLLKSSVF